MKDQVVLLCKLHGFSDASERVYAAVAYMKIVYQQGGAGNIQFVASRTRVYPLKKQSIPRLELLGATILARLINSVRGLLHKILPQIEIYCWVDSFTTLCWIRNDRPWKAYIQSRVNEIRKLTNKNNWRFCPGKANPADLPSRSCLAEDLARSDLWWHGPPFLRETEDHWLDMPTTLNQDKANEELVKHPPPITYALVAASDHPTVRLDAIIDADRHGSKTKLLRVTVMVVKFTRLCQKDIGSQRSSGTLELTVQDLQSVQELWIKSIQRQGFSNEYHNLVNNKREVLFKQLNLFLDENGIICCKGRLGNANVSSYANDPILLTHKHWFYTLLIKDHHCRVHHNGIRDTLNLIRGRYWIIKGREAVKRVVRKCVICLKVEGRPYPTPTTPDLPEERVSDGPPFVNTGVDFARPLYVQNGTQGEQVKAYVCLFTCAATRAVHLELTPDLSAATFLLAFSRFSARRSTPGVMISDNVKVFQSASSVIKKVIRAKEVNKYMLNNQIRWNFIVEKVLCWGAFWERPIGSVKRCLKKTVGRYTLTFEEMRTLLVEIECTLNSRPLTYLYDEIEGVSQPLTPADWIYGRQIVKTGNGCYFEVISTAQSLTKRVRYEARLLTQFTNCWHCDYLLGLKESRQKSPRNQRDTPSIQAGDIVILHDDLTARCWWRLARVIELLKEEMTRYERQEYKF